MAELSRAISGMVSRDKTTSPIIPVKIDNTAVPKAPSHIQSIDMTTGNDPNLLLLESLQRANARA
jgi:hypothetical protein